MKHALGWGLLCSLWLVAAGALAQNITADEMEQLDKLRASAKERGVDLTAEQEIQWLQRLRAFKALAEGGPDGIRARGAAAVNSPKATPQPATALPTISEAELASRLNALPPGRPVAQIEMLRDGLEADGRRFVDPQGRAERIAVDAASGTAAYLVASGSGHDIKVARLDSAADAVTIGRLRKDGAVQVFESLTGKTLGGDAFYPLIDGVLVLRDSVVFRYTVGQGIRQIDLPKGWYPAPLQRGNLSTTGWLLLERDTSEEKQSPFAVFKNLGTITGLVRANDYMLFDLAQGKGIEFDISADQKNVVSMSQCRRRNAVVNVCDKMTSYESIWSPDGSANLQHYFWKIDWQRVNGHPVAVVMERSLIEVNAYDLESGKRVNLFERSMGINGWKGSFNPDGGYRVSARLAFETQQIDDVAVALRERPEFPKK